MNADLLKFAAGLIFGAGGFFWMVNRMKKDLNGLGAKYGRMVALTVRWADTDEKREQVAKLIEGK